MNQQDNNRGDLPLINLLSALTDAILADEKDLDAITRQYDVPRRDLEGMVRIIRRLHVALIGVRPSPRFVAQLKTDLMGERRMSMVNRVRYLPPRVQIAAGIALVAGFMLLARRRLASVDAQDVLPAESTVTN